MYKVHSCTGLEPESTCLEHPNTEKRQGVPKNRSLRGEHLVSITSTKNTRLVWVKYGVCTADVRGAIYKTGLFLWDPGFSAIPSEKTRFSIYTLLFAQGFVALSRCITYVDTPNHLMHGLCIQTWPNKGKQTKQPIWGVFPS